MHFSKILQELQYRFLHPNMRCKLKEKIALCDMVLNDGFLSEIYPITSEQNVD